jgi:chemotaxis protein MotB
MRMRGKADKRGKGDILIRKEEVVEGEAHGGSWKVAYADFVTAMMAFFLLMWLLNATTEEQRKGLADYFSPNSVLSHNSSGTGQPFGGRTAFSDGAMLSDLGSPQVTVGQQPVVDRIDDDGSDVIVQPRPHRDDTPSKQPDQGGRPPPRPPPRQAQNAAPAGPVPVAATTTQGRGDVQRRPTEAELQAELEKREKQAFEQAAQQIQNAVGNDPELAELARQLAIDMTPEGLRIQIRDADREPMFPFGSAIPNDKARLLLQKVAPVLARMTQDISIAGHTDAAPFSGSGRTNWELSADRANATRRLLVDSGLQESRIRSVTGNAERDLAVPGDPLAAANRRIAIVVLRSAKPQPEAP